MNLDQISNLPYLKELRRFLSAAKIVFTPVAIAVLLYLVWVARADLTWVVSGASYLSLVVVVLIWAALHTVFPLFTVIALGAFDLPITYRKALKIHLFRLPAKYLPGGVWHTLARGVDYKEEGLSVKQVSLYFVLENAVLVGVTLFLGGVVVLNGWWLAICVVFCMALLSLPLLLSFFLSSFSKSVSLSKYYSSVVVVAVYWALIGSVFVLFMSSFPTVSLSVSEIQLGGIYVFSWAVGYLAIFAPQGIGVSEFVASNLLELDGLVGMLVGFRVLIMVGDLVGYFLARILLGDGR